MVLEKKTKLILLSYFGSIDNIKTTGIDDLKKFQILDQKLQKKFIKNLIKMFKIANIPNILTLLRILIIPIILVFWKLIMSFIDG